MGGVREGRLLREGGEEWEGKGGREIREASLLLRERERREGGGERREGEAKRGRGGGSMLGKEGDMEGGVRRGRLPVG